MNDANDFYDIREVAIQHMKNINKNILEKWCKDIGYDEPIAYYNSLSERKIIIYARRPGILIGRAGINLNPLKEELKKEFNCDYTIEFVEIRGEFVNLNNTQE